jgi:hypothetical protein
VKPIAFPGANVTWAKDQPQYHPLPAYRDDERTVSCYALSWRERFILLLTGRLWLSQLNRGAPLQPQLPSVTPPYFTQYTIETRAPS